VVSIFLSTFDGKRTLVNKDESKTKSVNKANQNCRSKIISTIDVISIRWYERKIRKVSTLVFTQNLVALNINQKILRFNIVSAVWLFTKRKAAITLLSVYRADE
jgi:hypothetical protein